MSFATYRDLIQTEDWSDETVTYKRSNRVNWTRSTRQPETQEHFAEPKVAVERR